MAITITAQNIADMFIPGHIGQYLQMTAGANAGNIGRIVTFLAPNSALNIGSAVTIDPLVTFEAFSAPTGTFQVGEPLTFPVGTGTLLYAATGGTAGHWRFAISVSTGSISQGDTVTGSTSGATVATSMLTYNPVWSNEAPVGGMGGASWRILDWVVDLGVAITNPASPSGGLAPMLDGIGQDRNIPRSFGESDAAYRQRIHQIADVVTPNAIRRTLNRTLGTVPWCFREVGTPALPGFYYDRTNDQNGDAYDYDVITFTATLSSGTPQVPGSADGFQEVLTYTDSTGLVLKATGWLGRWSSGTSTLTFIRKSGVGTAANPAVIAAGDTVTGMSSGAVWSVTAILTQAPPDKNRFSLYFDYTDFRAHFEIGVPRSGLGEFGFAWGLLPAGNVLNSPNNFYDASPFPDFYDGSPAMAGVLYKQLYQAVDRVRAGGVTFDLYLEDGTCPAASAPTLSGVNYTVGDTAGGGQPIVLSGTNLGETLNVAIGGVHVPSFVSTATTITFVLPARAAAANLDITITTPGGTATLSGVFTYWTPIQISGVDTFYDSNKGISFGTGTQVTTWTDQVAAVAATQATAGDRPNQVAGVFGALPSMRFAPQQWLKPPSKRILAAGLSIFYVCAYTSTRATATEATINPPLTVIGDDGGSTTLNVGHQAGLQAYVVNDGSWVTTLHGTGNYNDGSPRLIGWTHSTGGQLKGYHGATQQGSTTTGITYDTVHNGYSTIGVGFLDVDGFAGDLGCLVVVSGIISGGDLALLNSWSQQRYGAV